MPLPIGRDEDEGCKPLTAKVMTRSDLTRQRKDVDAAGHGRDGRFPETRWSLISELRGGADKARERALADLCRIYWFPIFSFARRRGCDVCLAEDLTQDLFVKFLSHEAFAAADRERGRLRSYLLTSMSRLMASHVRHNSAAKRAPGWRAMSFERDFPEGLPAEESGGEAEFDRAWAQALLREVEMRLGHEYRARGKEKQFAILKKFLVAPPPEDGYGETSAALGLSNGATKVAVFRMRKRFKALLLDEIKQTVTDHESVEDELRHLHAALAKAPAVDRCRARKGS